MAELTPSEMDGQESLLLTCDHVAVYRKEGRIISAMFFKETSHILFLNDWSRRNLREQGLETRGELRGLKIPLVRVVNRNPKTGGKHQKYQIAAPPEWEAICGDATEAAEGVEDPRQRPREVSEEDHREHGEAREPLDMDRGANDSPATGGSAGG